MATAQQFLVRSYIDITTYDLKEDNNKQTCINKMQQTYINFENKNKQV